MRTKRYLPARRRARAAVLNAGLLLATVAALAGCSGSSSSSGSAASGSGYAAVQAPAPAASAAASAGGEAGPASAGGSSSGGSSSAAAALIRSGQQLIETAQLTVRAPSVSAAISRATSVVSAAGGYVSAENAAAGHGQPSQATATVTFKIPVAAYPATLAALSGTGLGTQLALAQQAQDVTQQVADTGSRVTSDQLAIGQLRDLLKRAGSVSSLLSVQNQIDAQESDLEAMLAQQSALDHETTYATVTLTLVGPKAAAAPKKAAPPPGLAAGLSGGWHALR
ncbi:MAG TPA: DUF4349 domain-containing protein, partial [Trebonia sp.]